MPDDMTQDEIDAILKGAASGAKTQQNPNPLDNNVIQEANSPSTHAEVQEQAVFGQNEEVTTSQEQINQLEKIPVEPSKDRSNIDFLLDIPLEISVELGRTKIPLKDMLQLGHGSVIELNKLIGEPVDMLVNDRLIAQGEVVVFDENFGIRITNIIKPEDRIRSLR